MKLINKLNYFKDSNKIKRLLISSNGKYKLKLHIGNTGFYRRYLIPIYDSVSERLNK
jgi:hypothetical protein